jgi:hypothetical protein
MSCPALDEMFSYAAENYVAPTQTAPGVNVVADVTLEVTGRFDSLTWFGYGAGQMWYTPRRFSGPVLQPSKPGVAEPQFVFLVPAQFTITNLAMDWETPVLVRPGQPVPQPRKASSLANLAVIAPHLILLPPITATYTVVVDGAIAGSADPGFSALIDGQLTPQCMPGYVWGPNPTTAGSVTLIPGNMATYPSPSLGE